jgi:pyrroloquinoline quinone biosynthesis protein B
MYVHVILLGTAAGGGFPQWNCWCPSCLVARRDPASARHRSQSSTAISADGQRWFLLNASPDVRDQLARLPSGPSVEVRRTPIEGVLLTDAELDHTLGFVLLREARHLPLYTTAAIRSMLECDSRILPMTRAFAEVPVTELPLETPQMLHYRDGSSSGLSAEAFVVPAGPPRFARSHDLGHTVGMLVRDEEGGSVCAFVPACGGLDTSLLERIARADLLLFDGTFWTDNELIALGIGDRTARQMDHLPISGPDGSLEQLGRLQCRHRVYVHINNTNPMLVENSAERALVEQAGVVVGMDGLQFIL